MRASALPPQHTTAVSGVTLSQRQHHRDSRQGCVGKSRRGVSKLAESSTCWTPSKARVRRCRQCGSTESRGWFRVGRKNYRETSSLGERKLLGEFDQVLMRDMALWASAVATVGCAPPKPINGRPGAASMPPRSHRSEAEKAPGARMNQMEVPFIIDPGPLIVWRVVPK